MVKQHKTDSVFSLHVASVSCVSILSMWSTYLSLVLLFMRKIRVWVLKHGWCHEFSKANHMHRMCSVACDVMWEQHGCKSIQTPCAFFAFTTASQYIGAFNWSSLPWSRTSVLTATTSSFVSIHYLIKLAIWNLQLTRSPFSYTKRMLRRVCDCRVAAVTTKWMVVGRPTRSQSCLERRRTWLWNRAMSASDVAAVRLLAAVAAAGCGRCWWMQRLGGCGCWHAGGCSRAGLLWQRPSVSAQLRWGRVPRLWKGFLRCK